MWIAEVELFVLSLLAELLVGAAKAPRDLTIVLNDLGCMCESSSCISAELSSAVESRNFFDVRMLTGPFQQGIDAEMGEGVRCSS